MSKKLIKFALFLALFFITSCVTKALWDNSYKEKFRQFLVSTDGRYVVFIGNKFHYVFSDETANLRDLLLWQRRDLLFINVDKSHINLDRQRNISGHVYIETFYVKLPPRETEYLRSLGFRKDEGSNVLSIKIDLKGKRFIPTENLSPYLPVLDRPYVIPIHVQNSLPSKAGKTVLTPITFSLDVALLAGKILIWPLKSN